MFNLEKVKGRYITGTLSLSSLLASGAVTDAHFADQANITKVIVKLKSTEGNQEILIPFIKPENFNGTDDLSASVFVSAGASDSFELTWLILIDAQGGTKTVTAASLGASATEFETTFTSIETGPTPGGGNGETGGLAMVTPGVYENITVDALGRVTAGNNPTTLVGYGIVDAVQKGSSEALGSAVAVECRPLLIGDASDNYANAFVAPSNFDAATVSSKRLVLNAGADPATVGDDEASFGGIVLKGFRDHYLLYDVANGAWNTSDNINLSCETGIKIDNKVALDEQKVKVGSRVKGGIIYLGNGEHDTFRYRVVTEGNKTKLLTEYRGIDGQWSVVDQVSKEVQNPEVNMYIEKSGEEAKKPSLVAGSLAYNYWPMVESVDGVLTAKLNLNTDDAVAMGRIMKRSMNFNGSIPGPMLKAKPGDILAIDFENEIEDAGEIEPWMDGEMQRHQMLHMHLDDRAYPGNANPMPLEQATIWMQHVMTRGQTNLHTHGFHVRPDGFGDNVMRTAKPGSKLRYYYELPANHFGGLQWFHPHGHGGSMNGVTRGAIGTILIEGPYQERLNAAQVEREYMILQRLEWADNLNGHDELNWVDYVSNLQLDMYDPDAEPQADGQKVSSVTPLDLSPYYKDNTDPKCICTCAALEGNAPHVHNNVSMANPSCTPIDVRWVPTVNGQKKPVYSIKKGELKVFSMLNATGITFYRISVKDHDLVIVGRDGMPTVPASPFASGSVDPDCVFNPHGQRLNYIICNSGQRFEYFIVPKEGVTVTDGDYPVYMLPMAETEIFAEGLDAPVQIATLRYSGEVLETESNHVSKIESLFPSQVLDDPNNIETLPKDKSNLQYITSFELLQSLMPQTNVTIQDASVTVVDGVATIVMPDDKPHHFKVGQKITINELDYFVSELDADLATFKIAQAEVLVDGLIDFSYDLFKVSTINNQSTENQDLQIWEILTDHCFYNDVVLDVEILKPYIARQRYIDFSIHGRGTAGMGSGSTYMDLMPYNDMNRSVGYLGTNEEFIIQNKSDVLHLFHIHINCFQVMGYRDGVFGANQVGSPVASNYDFSEIAIPFQGFDDTTSIPVGVLSENPIVADEADPGSRGEVRMRTTFEDFTGLFLMHCHLLDDQDMGMMQSMEVVAPGYVQAPLSVTHTHG